MCSIFIQKDELILSIPLKKNIHQMSSTQDFSMPISVLFLSCIILHQFYFLICYDEGYDWFLSSLPYSPVLYFWCLVFKDNPIFILNVSLDAQHCRYHCDYTRTQISLTAFKCYRADLLNNFFFCFFRSSLNLLSHFSR